MKKILKFQFKTRNKMNWKQMLSNNKVGEVLDGLSELYPNNEDLVLLYSRYNSLKRQEQNGIISFENKNIESNRIRHALSSLIDELQSEKNQVKKGTMESTVETHLKSLVQDTKLQRLKPELYNKAQELLRQFRDYDDKKSSPGSVYDSSGRIKEMLNQAYQNLKNDLSETNKDSKEDFEAFVNQKLGTGIPSWSTIDEVYVIAVGRKFQNDYIERCLKNKPDDDMAKLECVDLIINWTKRYLQ